MVMKGIEYIAHGTFFWQSGHSRHRSRVM